jgi:hypothetical protein
MRVSRNSRAVAGQTGERTGRGSTPGPGHSPTGWTRGPSYNLRAEQELADADTPWLVDDWAADDWTA